MRVFVTVKTYPVLSGRYIETACSAGIDEQGRWVRLYPIPFRLLDRQNQYRKYQWIEVSAERNRQDMRPESHLVTDVDAIRLCETIGPENQWAARRELVLAGRPPVYDELAEIVRLAHNNEISLAIFKPAEIIDFRSEDAEPWPEARIQRAINMSRQQELFNSGQRRVQEFTFVEQIPKRFFYEFKDVSGSSSTLMIEDWETGMLYRNLINGGATVAEAVQGVRAKYLDDFARTKDLHFFLGTVYKWHNMKSPNPFVIVGTFHPPRQTKPTLI